MELGLIQAALPYALRSAQVASGVICFGLMLGGLRPLVFSAAPEVAPLQAPAAAPAGEAQTRTAELYAVIGGRNLFRAKVLVAAPAPEPTPVIEKSQLALRLVGTMYSPTPKLSVAVLEENAGMEPQVLGIGDSVSGGKAKLVRIEQRRVVIEHEGRLEAIEIDPNDPMSAIPRGALRRAQVGEMMIQNRGRSIVNGRAPTPMPGRAARSVPPPLPGRPRRAMALPGMIVPPAPQPGAAPPPPPADG